MNKKGVAVTPFLFVSLHLYHRRGYQQFIVHFRSTAEEFEPKSITFASIYLNISPKIR